MFTGTLDETSNAEDWIETLDLIDDSTGDPVDLTGASANLAVRAAGSALPVLTGTLTDGHLIVMGLATQGVLRIRFTKTAMLPLVANEYDVGLTITFADGTTEQIIRAQLPVVDGIVRT